jgi:hypothetical protein
MRNVESTKRAYYFLVLDLRKVFDATRNSRLDFCLFFLTAFMVLIIFLKLVCAFEYPCFAERR